jgi:5'-3' exonuclease
MNQQEKKLLIDWQSGKISKEDFLAVFPVDIRNNKNYIISEIEKAIETAEIEEIELAINLIWLSDNEVEFIDLLHKLLLNPNHRSHQYILKSLQDLRNPRSVLFIKKALETNFDYIPYTGSDSYGIAKWFSWALASIGTNEAIELIKEYSHSEEEGIREEMSYRLKRIKEGL